MTRVPDPVGMAVVLAAGNGDRFPVPGRGSKLLQTVAGQPLILRTLETARLGGISSAIVVLGYEAERLRIAIDEGAPPGMDISYALNDEWHLENGLSVLAARPLVGRRRFALLMGDHIFDPVVLDRLRHAPVYEDESLLAVDGRPMEPAAAAEATKVRLAGSQIVAIGKNLHPYDAFDTGLFVCAPVLFDALDAARRDGDTTLSAGIGRLAERGLMQALDIDGATWCDIDTASDLEAAESVLGAAVEPV